MQATAPQDAQYARAVHRPLASITTQRGRLYLLASVPRRDGLPGLQQTRIALKLDDTAVNRRIATKQLATLSRQLATGSFEWGYWLDQEARGVTWREAMDRLYRSRVVMGQTSERTWDLSYVSRFRHVDPTATVTTSGIAAALQQYDRDSCTYKEFWYLLRQLSRLVEVPFPELPVPTYNQAKPVAVPTDEQIIEWVEGAGPSSWYFGMMAAYGLRPHEVEGATLIERDFCQVQDETKTGFRTVVPLPREWVERFDLRERRLRPRLANSKTGGNVVSRWLFKELRRLDLPWRPYSLRHAYAGRLWKQGGNRLDIYTAARLMGHTPTQHAKTYRAHIQPHQVAEAAERALNDG